MKLSFLAVWLFILESSENCIFEVFTDKKHRDEKQCLKNCNAGTVCAFHWAGTLREMEMPQMSHFSREIILVLLLKVLLIFGLWWFFFRAEEVPTAEQVSRALLTSVNQEGVKANDQH